MNLFFHDVGQKGANRDFPRTVFNSVGIDVVEKNAPEHLRDEMVSSLHSLFPSGKFNCWGVPVGAKSVIGQLEPGDVMLLVQTTSGEGVIPALCPVVAFWKEPMFNLSQALWEDTRFPFIFFFTTRRIYLTWAKLKRDIGYAHNFRPRGNTYRIREDRFNRFGGANNYVLELLGSRISDKPTPPSTEYL